MKKTAFLAFLFTVLIMIDSSGQVKSALEFALPSGWRYKSFSASPSGIKALYLLPDFPGDVLAAGRFPRRLRVFGRENDLLADLTIEDGYWLDGISKNNRIVLCDGDAGFNGHVKVLALSGKELYTVDTEGRWPVAAPDGNDIALVPGLEDAGPVSIIDEDTGREKARIGQSGSNSKTYRISAFFPFGEDGLYVQGVGATLMLKSYLHFGKVYWKIQDIGGNIKQGILLNDEYLAVSYRTDDLSGRKFAAGVAVVEWRTGNVLFNRKGHQNNGVQDRWYPNFNSLSLLIDEDGGLLFYADPDEVMRLPRRSDGKRGWDENRIVMSRLSPDQRGEVPFGNKLLKPQVIAGKYVVSDLGDAVRIEKARYTEERLPGR